MSNVPVKSKLEQLPEIRNKLLDRMMKICAFLAVPALAASLSRATDVGWRFSMSIQVIVFLAVWGAVIFRDALSYRARYLILLTVLAFLAISSFLSFGILTGPLWSLTAVVFITLVLGKRAGMWAAGLVLALIAVIYALYATGVVTFDQDFNRYMHSPISWINSFTSMLLVSSGIVIIVAGLYGALEKSLAEVEEEYRDRANISLELQVKAAEQQHILTEYRDAIARLGESEEKFRMIAENTSDFIWMLDMDGNMVHAGANSVQFTGYTPEEMAAVPIDQRYTADFAARIRAGVAGIRAKLEAGENVPDGLVVVQCIKKSGELAWHEARYRVSSGADGKHYIIGISRDVTERVRVENEKEEHSRLLAALDRVNRAMSGTPDLDGLMAAVLAEALDIFGCQRAILIYPCDPDSPWWTAMMESAAPGYDPVGSLGRKVPMQPLYAALMKEYLAAEFPLQQLRSETDQTQRSMDEKLGVKSRLAMAVRLRGDKPWVFVLHQCTHERVWTDFEKELMKQVGLRLGDGLSLALMLSEVKGSEERFRSLLSSMSDWVWECDKSGIITFASDQVADILGYRPEEIVGMSYTHLLMPGEVERVSRTVAELAKQRKPIRNLENWNRARDGKPVCILTNGLPLFDSEGRLTGYRGVDTDITERKLNEQALVNSERRFRELFQSASLGILIVNGRNRIIDANTEALRMLGYTLAEIRKIGCESLVDTREPQSRPLITIERETGSEGVESHRRRFLRRNGSEVHVQVSVSASTEGVFIVMFNDLTDQRKIERQLFQAQKLEAVGELADGIALAFNNILHAIAGFSSLLKADPDLPEKSRVYVGHIGESAGRGAALVRGIMALSSSNSDEMQVLNLAELLRRSVGFMSSTFPRNVAITSSFGHGSARVEADPSRIEQVIMNLATNARDAMAEGGKLTLSTGLLSVGPGGSQDWPEAAPGDYMTIRISDTGKGIPPEIAAHVFDPFFSTKEEGKGTGLGLSTVYSIVANHKGHVRFESVPGRTEFTVLLPVKDMGSGGEAPVVGRQEDRAEASPGGGTVLVVDDEAYIREIAAEGLRSDGFEVIAVGSGEEAVEIVRRGEVNISTVVLDLAMPGMGGEKCMELLLDARPDLRVIVASGYGVSDVVEQLLASGAAAFLKKPYRTQALSDTVAGKISGKVFLPIAIA